KKTDASRILALGALADLADPSSAPLFERLKDDRDEALRLYANEGIARTADQAMATQISAARLAEKSARGRMAHAFPVLRLGQSEYLDELVRGLERRQTRNLAKEYLLETQGADRRALFAPRTANPAVRAELAEVMGLMGDPDALPTLHDMAQDADKDVASAASRAARRRPPHVGGERQPIAQRPSTGDGGSAVSRMPRRRNNDLDGERPSRNRNNRQSAVTDESDSDTDRVKKNQSDVAACVRCG